MGIEVEVGGGRMEFEEFVMLLIQEGVVRM